MYIHECERLSTNVGRLKKLIRMLTVYLKVDSLIAWAVFTTAFTTVSPLVPTHQNKVQKNKSAGNLRHVLTKVYFLDRNVQVFHFNDYVQYFVL